MSEPADMTVLIADVPLTAADCQAVSGLVGGGAVMVVALNEAAGQGEFDAAWTQRSVSEFFDGDQLREDFLTFLDAWPTKPIHKGRSFDELFRRADGESLWWTGPGTERHPDKGVFLQMRSVWLARRILDAMSPSRLILHSRNSALAVAVGTLASPRGIDMVCTNGSPPGRYRLGPRWKWLLASLAWLAMTPWRWLGRSIMARHATGKPIPRPEGPALVLTGTFPRYARFSEEGTVGTTFWREIQDQLAAIEDAPAIRYLLHTIPGTFHGHHPVGWGHTAWPKLKGTTDILPLQETHWPIGAYLRSLSDQIASLFRYAKLERDLAFRSSFTFAGADVLGLYAPLLRQQVARMTSWEMTVAAIEASLKQAGDVRVMLVVEEFYNVGMMDIAAARRLGITTLGAQHGTLFPMHLVYTLPAGQVDGAPTPDGFAVYGDYARDVVTQVGHFPAERVRVTGGPRLDRWVNAPPDQAAARAAMDLPADKTVLLLATQFYPWFQQAGRAVFEAVAGREDCIVCVKTHPKDVPLSVYETLAREAGATNVRFYDAHFDELLAACDVLISGSSTTVFEAIMLGRGTICVNFSDEPDRYPYVASGGSVPAHNTIEMRDAVATVLSPEYAGQRAAGRSKFLARHAGPGATGQAARTLAELILSLAKEGSSVCR